MTLSVTFLDCDVLDNVLQEHPTARVLHKEDRRASAPVRFYCSWGPRAIPSDSTTSLEIAAQAEGRQTCACPGVRFRQGLADALSGVLRPESGGLSAQLFLRWKGRHRSFPPDSRKGKDGRYQASHWDDRLRFSGAMKPSSQGS
jgi:hypothetical protein